MLQLNMGVSGEFRISSLWGLNIWITLLQKSIFPVVMCKQYTFSSDHRGVRSRDLGTIREDRYIKSVGYNQ